VKTLTPQEFFRAVADGQKVAHKSWPAHEWMQLKGKIFIGEDGCQTYPEINGDESYEDDLDGYYIWPYQEEPTPQPQFDASAAYKQLYADMFKLSGDVRELREKCKGAGIV
jgi:hypothetical protein